VEGQKPSNVAIDPELRTAKIEYRYMYLLKYSLIVHLKQCCGSEYERIRNFLMDPNPNKKFGFGPNHKTKIIKQRCFKEGGMGERETCRWFGIFPMEKIDGE
jgi:hypothetical protein